MSRGGCVESLEDTLVFPRWSIGLGSQRCRFIWICLVWLRYSTAAHIIFLWKSTRNITNLVILVNFRFCFVSAFVSQLSPLSTFLSGHLEKPVDINKDLHFFLS